MSRGALVALVLSLVALALAIMLAGCGPAGLISVQPDHSWIDGDASIVGVADWTPAGGLEGQIETAGVLDVGATAKVCIGRGVRRLCAPVTSGFFVEGSGGAPEAHWCLRGPFLNECWTVLGHESNAD